MLLLLPLQSLLLLLLLRCALAASTGTPATGTSSNEHTAHAPGRVQAASGSIQQLECLVCCRWTPRAACISPGRRSSCQGAEHGPPTCVQLEETRGLLERETQNVAREKADASFYRQEASDKVLLQAVWTQEQGNAWCHLPCRSALTRQDTRLWGPERAPACLCMHRCGVSSPCIPSPGADAAAGWRSSAASGGGERLRRRKLPPSRPPSSRPAARHGPLCSMSFTRGLPCQASLTGKARVPAGASMDCMSMGRGLQGLEAYWVVGARGAGAQRPGSLYNSMPRRRLHVPPSAGAGRQAPGLAA